MVIREMISAAIQDMPEDERIVQLLQGSYINYFHCVRIVDILKDTEQDTKNFLGYYSSRRMNDWMQIEQLYKKGNVYLAEAAQILQRMVQYEIPALKKQILKSDQIIAECERKASDYAKQAIEGKKQYEKELLKMGIKDINYFHCVRIVDILKDTEQDTKNFLGYYSSRRMNDWMQIEQLYKKGNVYLAEAAQILQRMVQYEIPALKKQILKSDQIIAECERKASDYAKQAVEGKKQYEKELLKMGIKGVNLRQEIIALLSDLSPFQHEIVNLIRLLNEPMHYYEHFRSYQHQGREPAVELLPLCRLLMARGAEVTVYEWKNGSEPTRIEKPSLEVLARDEVKDADDEIDFGDDPISYKDEIDFGDSDLMIEVVGDEKARDSDALTVLENPDTRQLVYFELRELEKFLETRRMDEITESASDIYISGMEDRPATVRKVTVGKIDDWLKEVSEVINKLCDAQKAHLFRMRSSPQYVEELAEKLEQKRSLQGRYEKMQSLMFEKQDEVRNNAQKAQIQLNEVCEATKTLQKEVSLTLQ
ncbi:unnamed protein product [Gongylonema pulchrum]|uniref:TPR_REGION domain-containing protein n=1 Tax=Gongylonema pulchrum TaxID=637853 RepID=A0A183E5H7_9BILA|nr:unnamed protein product [Gongylonema pulchrum]